APERRVRRPLRPRPGQSRRVRPGGLSGRFRPLRPLYCGVPELAFSHQSVLLDETAALLAGCRRVLDGTAGAGGHSLRLAEAGADVLAIDRDPQAVAAAE